MTISIGPFVGAIIGAFLFGIIVGVVVGFKIANKMTKKQLEENPPITEEQIRAMYAQMGRKPSEQQIRQIMNNFKRKVNEKK